MLYTPQAMMQPQPMMPMQPHVQMQAPNPQFVYVQAPPMQTPYAQPMQQAPVYDQRAQLLQAQEEAEIEELRASVRDIRDVVDNLANRRSANRNYR
ncbi:MAG: hypothetical protein U5K75_05765 [Ahrensia sp.]|nr:hypothetical protein [Ahrensia sp.]